MDLLLAQTTEAAAEGVGILQTIVNGGAALILACLVVVLGWVVYKLATRANALEEGFRGKVEALLREMLDKDRANQEALTAAVLAVEGVTSALEEQKAACDEAARQMDNIQRELRELREAVNRCPTR